MLFVASNELKNRYANRNKTITIKNVNYFVNSNNTNAKVEFEIVIGKQKTKICKTYNTSYSAKQLWNDHEYITKKSGKNILVPIDGQNYESLEILNISMTNTSVNIDYQRRYNGKICAACIEHKKVIIVDELII